MTTPLPQFSNETKVVIEAARQAGEKIMSIYQKGFSVTLKDVDQSPVTEADLASNAILLQELTTLGYPILSEETADNPARLKAKTVWIIDPLDGTSDFIRHTVEFSVMIALVNDHRPSIGVVYQPSVNKLFVAEVGQGAWLVVGKNYQRLHVSGKREQIRVISSHSHLSDDEQTFIAELKVVEHRKMGSAGLKAAEVASAKAEIYFTTTNKIKQWDTAAAYCLISEAGGRLTDMHGQSVLYNTPELAHLHGLLITNGSIHDEIVSRYRAFEKTFARKD